ncbi:MAG: FkbM family methyltransferase [Bacteroidetes bacterium]|jgi:FkbM family methyltransferase|nr:FkbM family methyltransferase [Bacteroidota bacterium]
MKTIEKFLTEKPRYVELLGKEQALRLLELFSEIESGKYDKSETHSFTLSSLKHPVTIRAIRADMQSFVNTFIDPYLEKKPYMSDTKLVIDAGANIGYTAVLFANWWPQSKIISIEPDTENFHLAVKNTSAYSNIEVIHGGLWTKTIDLQIEAGQEDGFVVREVKNKMAILKENLTKGISIDEILKRYKASQIDFLKMNVEGSEKEIFSANYKNWLPDTKVMLIELHDGKNQGCSKAVFSAVGPYDFAVADTAPYGVLFVKEKVYRKWYANWYKEEIYKPNINKKRFPEFYLDSELKD